MFECVCKMREWTETETETLNI